MTAQTQPRSLVQDVLHVYDSWSAQVIVYVATSLISLGAALFLDLRLRMPSERVLIYMLPFTAASLILLPTIFFALRRLTVPVADKAPRVEDDAMRRVELDVLQNAAHTTQQRVEEEKQIRNQLETLRIADVEARKRIEDANSRRRESEVVYRMIAKEVQSVEAAAALRAFEERQILAKLERVRRRAAIEAQARAEQEKRIKEEIEQFRRLEDEERFALDVAAFQRTPAQELSQQQRGRVQQEIDEDLEILRSTDEIRETRAVGNKDHSAPVLTATIQTYLNSVDPYKRAAAVAELAQLNARDAFELIAKFFDDPSPHVRNSAARALRKLESSRTADLFNRALEEGSDERRRNIGAAIAASGLATEAIDDLVGDSREDTYNALLILFVMAKTGEVQPLVKAIEEHENLEVCKAVIKLLTLTGQDKLGDEALQRRATGVSGPRRISHGLDQAGTVKDG